MIEEISQYFWLSVRAIGGLEAGRQLNLATKRRLWSFSSGHLGEMEPPFPIPNREVKRFSADNRFPAKGSEKRSWPEPRDEISPDPSSIKRGEDKIR